MLSPPLPPLSSPPPPTPASPTVPFVLRPPQFHGPGEGDYESQTWTCACTLPPQLSSALPC